jgi:hypothetical protein
MGEQHAGTLALMPLWLAMAGGLLTIASWALDSPVVALVGATVFVAGVILLFVAALRDSPRSGLGLGAAVRRSAAASLRFAFRLMP